MYREGQGVPQDDTEAAKWYNRAAGQGLGAAQCNLGVMYATGRGVQQDYAEAVVWIRRAAEQGHAHAQGSLGLMYQTGIAVVTRYSISIPEAESRQDHKGTCPDVLIRLAFVDCGHSSRVARFDREPTDLDAATEHDRDIASFDLVADVPLFSFELDLRRRVHAERWSSIHERRDVTRSLNGEYNKYRYFYIIQLERHLITVFSKLRALLDEQDFWLVPHTNVCTILE